MGRQYIYDKENFRFRKFRRNVSGIIRKAFIYFIASVSLAVVYYFVFAVFINTGTERRLKRENRMFEKVYPQMEEKERLLSDVVAGLKTKDNDIYMELFRTPAPSGEDRQVTDFLSGEVSASDKGIVKYTEEKLKRLEKSSSRVDENLKRILEICSSGNVEYPPLSLPLKDFSYARTGASVGEKINPFYRVESRHDGLDMIAQSGDPVLASADGTVCDVVRSKRGLGNVVSVDHGNGYVTKYAHLGDIEVVKGRHVKKGSVLGYVGVSGNTFAPHLHYEVHKDTVVLDPVNYFFGSVTPYEYADMLYLSVMTTQSMD